MENKHTELPWIFNKAGNDHDQWMIYNELSGKTLAIVFGKANAEFITLACNNHYQLLDALKKVRSIEVAARINNKGIFTRTELSDLNKAIAAATGKEG